MKRHSPRDCTRVVGSDDISLIGLDLEKRPEREKLREWMVVDIENVQNGASWDSIRAPICADLAHNRLELAGIDLGCLFDIRSKNNPVDGCLDDDLVNQIKIMLSRFIREIDYAPRDAPCRGVKSGPHMICLKHIPVRKKIQMLR